MAAKVRSLFLVSPFTAFFAFVWHLWLTLSVSSCTMLLQEVSQICLALRYKRYKDDYLAHAIYGFRSLVVSAVVCIWACRERCKTGLWLQAFLATKLNLSGSNEPIGVKTGSAEHADRTLAGDFGEQANIQTKKLGGCMRIPPQ